MVKTDYKAVLEQAKKDLVSAQQELGECLRQQELVEAHIFGLRQTVVALSKMLGEEFDEDEAIGLTDVIRQAFKSKSGQTLTPTEVRGVVEGLGYDISKYGNFMASVHSVIKRLEGQGQIKQVGTRADSKPAYTWCGVAVLSDLLDASSIAHVRRNRSLSDYTIAPPPKPPVSKK